METNTRSVPSKGPSTRIEFLSHPSGIDEIGIEFRSKGGLMAAIAVPHGTHRVFATTADRRPRALPASVYWRRRAMVVLLIVGAAVGGPRALALLGGGPLTAAEVKSPAAPAGAVSIEAEPVARSTYVVRRGDTLWSIARHLQPSGDVRPLVDALASERDGRPLQPGERIVLP